MVHVETVRIMMKYAKSGNVWRPANAVRRSKNHGVLWRGAILIGHQKIRCPTDAEYCDTDQFRTQSNTSKPANRLVVKLMILLSATLTISKMFGNWNNNKKIKKLFGIDTNKWEASFVGAKISNLLPNLETKFKFVT